MYYNNFELCDISWFRSEPYQAWYDYVDRAGGIYYTRWGDHIIRYLGVRMFMPPQAIVKLNIHYWHDREFNRPG